MGPAWGAHECRRRKPGVSSTLRRMVSRRAQDYHQADACRFPRAGPCDFDLHGEPRMTAAEPTARFRLHVIGLAIAGLIVAGACSKAHSPTAPSAGGSTFESVRGTVLLTNGQP